MEAKSKLGRLLNRLRGEHKYCLDKGISFTSTMSESIGCGGNLDDEAPVIDPADDVFSDPLTPNIDLRYGGQYMTVEQLPLFCDQLNHLVQVIRNIQAYAEITAEYPAELERRLECEAREVAALAAETRHALDVIARTRLQRRAVRDQRVELEDRLIGLKDTEARELESTVRQSDRKLFKSWEAVKDASDPRAFEPLMEDITNKQTALECLTHLIQGRISTLSRKTNAPHPLPPPLPKDNEGSGRGSRARRGSKRRRREARSVPLSNEPSAHTDLPQQVTVVVGGAEWSRGRAAASAARLPAAGRGRDVLYFTANI